MNTPLNISCTAGANQMRAVDRILSSFEQSWTKGNTPQLENYLRESPQDVRAELFEALLRIEITWLLRRGKTPSMQEYQKRFPDKKDVVTALFSQVSEHEATKSQVAAHQVTNNQAEEWFFLRNGKPVGPF